MIVSDNISSLKELCSAYPEAIYQVSLFRDNLLTLEEIMLINRIIIGCSKFAYSKLEFTIYKTTPKKELAAFELLKQLSSNTLNQFSQSTIREKLYPEIQNIDKSDLSDLFKIFLETRYIQNIDLTKLTKKRGRPSKKTDSKKPGIKSYYQESDYHKKLKQVITKPNVRHLIFTYLLESNVIRLYLYKIYLYIFKELKIKKTFSNDIIHLKEGYIILNKNNINKLSKRLVQIQLMNRNWQQSDPLYDHFYISGGLYYFS